MTSNRGEALTTILGEFEGGESYSQISAEIKELGEGLHEYLKGKGIAEREASEITSEVGNLMSRVEQITELKFDDQLLNNVIRMEIDFRRAEALEYDEKCLSAVTSAKQRFSDEPTFLVRVIQSVSGKEIMERQETVDEARSRVDRYKRKYEVFHLELRNTDHQYPIKMIFIGLGIGEFYEQNEKYIMRFVADHAEVINQVADASADDEEFYKAIAQAAEKSVESKKIRESYENALILSLSVGRLERNLATLDTEQPLDGPSRSDVFNDLRLKMIPDRARFLGKGNKELSGEDIERISKDRIKLVSGQIVVDDEVLKDEGRNHGESFALREIQLLKALADMEETESSQT
ncbi:MAG: hypothetical protein ACD_22C00051G0006 [uncultured bacterium]|uniref:Uncharacterized protein n=1 Tax=candidate division WWE3 bacterium RBG_16_37_10 TaxID=1802610 RepID=A0A1F4UXG6_UNCKA|nr:MAG: hypothetical protein ACD_22C00051G0006 [uncultured bacterium]OGC49655.1 MAG: hypothetical protein A2W32_04945 [candidate division WWE3 bacterium RBG_16_37_10]